MKSLIVLLLMMPFALTAQTVKSYEKAMQKFQKLYNAGQGDKINAMFADNESHFKITHPLWTDATAAERLRDYGQLTAFKFIGIDTSDPENVYVFQTSFARKGKLTTSLTINKKQELGTFRFDASSEGIDRLLRKVEGR